MREIKFRAWDKDYEKMLLVTSIHFYNDETIVECFDEKDTDLSLTENTYRIILMQYTGLTDMNGKEIYEGDIVFIKRYLYEDTKDGDLYLAKWEKFGFSFRRKIKIKDGQKQIAKPSALINSLAIECHSEIIGNIYENPELLEGLKNG